MTLTKGDIALSVVCVVAGIVLGAGFRSCSSKPAEPAPADPVVIHDTVTITDTLRIKEHTKPKEVVKWDTCYLPAVDTITDSIFVQVPITEYEYIDTFETDSSRVEVGIQYQGFRAKINSIDINAEYTLHPEPLVIEQKKGFGHFAGISTGPCASITANPVTGQLQWGIGWSVQLTLYGYGFHY